MKGNSANSPPSEEENKKQKRDWLSWFLLSGMQLVLVIDAQRHCGKRGATIVQQIILSTIYSNPEMIEYFL